jgi:hypothetical protein
VSRAFKETSRRREVLTFTHHELVAGLDPARADALLAWCEEPIAAGGKRRSTRELRTLLLQLGEKKVKLEITRAPPTVIDIEDMPRPAYSPPARRETVYYTEVEESSPQPIDMEDEPEQDDYAEKLSAICDWLQSLSRERFIEAQATIAALSRDEQPAG